MEAAEEKKKERKCIHKLLEVLTLCCAVYTLMVFLKLCGCYGSLIASHPVLLIGYTSLIHVVAIPFLYLSLQFPDKLLLIFFVFNTLWLGAIIVLVFLINFSLGAKTKDLWENNPLNHMLLAGYVIVAVIIDCILFKDVRKAFYIGAIPLSEYDDSPRDKMRPLQAEFNEVHKQKVKTPQGPKTEDDSAVDDDEQPLNLRIKSASSSSSKQVQPLRLQVQPNKLQPEDKEEEDVPQPTPRKKSKIKPRPGLVQGQFEAISIEPNRRQEFINQMESGPAVVGPPAEGPLLDYKTRKLPALSPGAEDDEEDGLYANHANVGEPINTSPRRPTSAPAPALPRQPLPPQNQEGYYSQPPNE